MAAEHGQSQNIRTVSQLSSGSKKRQRSLCSESEDSDETPRKQHRRVSKACERCRLKKIKCDGEIPCQRCTDDMVTCCEGARKKGGSKTVAESFIDLLEHQQTKFIAGHLKMYRLMVEAGIWSYGEVRKNSRGTPVIHDILEKLGVMRSGSELLNGFPESLDENRIIRAQLEATEREKPPDHHKINTERKQDALEVSPPYLVYTNREHSIETCFSEIKPANKFGANLMTNETNLNFVLGLPSYEKDNCVFISSFPESNHEKTKLTFTQSNPLNSSSEDNVLGNYLARQMMENSFYSNKGNLFDVNQSFTMFDQMQSITQRATVSGGEFGNISDLSSPFKAVTNLEPVNYLRPTDLSIDITPKFMRFPYDPFMG